MSDIKIEASFSGIENVLALIIGIAGIILIISAFRFISPLDFWGRMGLGALLTGFYVGHIKGGMKSEKTFFRGREN